MSDHDEMTFDEKIDKAVAGQEVEFTLDEIELLEKSTGMNLSESVISSYKEELEIPLFVTMPIDIE